MVHEEEFKLDRIYTYCRGEKPYAVIPSIVTFRSKLGLVVTYTCIGLVETRETRSPLALFALIHCTI